MRATLKTMPEAEWSLTIERALENSPGLETWEGHFRHRMTELHEVSAYWPPGRVRRALEIGCGNGLAAIFFSPRAEHIVASDLAAVDVTAHSVGLDLAREFIRRTNVKNVEVLGCSAESIPLPDRSVDFVYGIYCLEHIPDRPRALAEIRRVLRPGGQTMLTVPGFAWSLVYPFAFYHALAVRILGRIRRMVFPAAAAAPSAYQHETKVTSASSFFHYYPHFPAPEPHGTHASWLAELFYYRAANWQRVMEAAGFTGVRVEPVSFLPAFVRALLPGPAVLGLESALRKLPFLKPSAQFFCLIGTSPGQSAESPSAAVK